MVQPIFKHILGLRFLVVVTAQVLLAGWALAFCLQPHPRVCNEFFKSDAIFTGTVIAETPVHAEGESIDGWVYRLRMKRSYRGPEQKIIEVFTANDTGRLPLEVGETYLLFARSYEGRLVIGDCGNSEKLSRSHKAIRQVGEVLRAAKSASGGEIGGVVGENPGGDVGGVAGIQVTARGGGKTYQGVTGKNGWFNIRVPAGRYVVSAESSRWAVIPYDLSYDDPRQIVVEKGGCADIQLIATPK